MPSSFQKLPRKSLPDKTLHNKPPRIIEEIIVKYTVDANLFRLGSTNPKKKKSSPWFFFSFFWAYCRGAFVGGAFVRGLLTYNQKT